LRQRGRSARGRGLALAEEVGRRSQKDEGAINGTIGGEPVAEVEPGTAMTGMAGTVAGEMMAGRQRGGLPSLGFPAAL
jgi:hypothetical protein